MDRRTAEANIGELVRINNKDSSWHWGRARLVGVQGTAKKPAALVKPFGHRGRVVIVPLRKVRLWKGRSMARGNGGNGNAQPSSR